MGCRIFVIGANKKCKEGQLASFCQKRRHERSIVRAGRPVTQLISARGGGFAGSGRNLGANSALDYKTTTKRGAACGGSGGSGGEGRAELARHPGVARGDAAGVVRDEREFDEVVADVDVGVVLGRFGNAGHAVDEGNGLDEGGQCPVADELAVLQRPLGQLCQQVAELLFGELLFGGFHGVRPRRVDRTVMVSCAVYWAQPAWFSGCRGEAQEVTPKVPAGACSTSLRMSLHSSRGMPRKIFTICGSNWLPLQCAISSR